MSRFTAIVITAAICLPVGALLHHDAAADQRKNSLPAASSTGAIDGYRHMSRATWALHEAAKEIALSQETEGELWSDPTGRAAAAKDAVDKAAVALDRTWSWVSDGLAAHQVDQPRRPRQLPLVRNQP